MKYIYKFFFTIGVLIVVSSCSTITYHTLNMKAYKEPYNKSVISPKLKEMKFSTVMVIPPSGTARGTFETQMSLFEQEFLRCGLSVVSSAITGKVVMDMPNKTNSKDEAASALSDLERALIMAKETGADLILQLGEFEWDHKTPLWKSRYFIAANTPGEPFREVTYDQWKSSSGYKKDFVSPRLNFRGKIIDVNNGRVLASLSYEAYANYNLEEDYIARYSFYNGSLHLESQNFRYSVSHYTQASGYTYEYPWFNEAVMRKTTMNLIRGIASQIGELSKAQSLSEASGE